MTLVLVFAYVFLSFIKPDGPRRIPLSLFLASRLHEPATQETVPTNDGNGRRGGGGRDVIRLVDIIARKSSTAFDRTIKHLQNREKNSPATRPSALP